MSLSTNVKYQIEVYDITYALPNTGIKDRRECSQYFIANKYPDILPETDGSDALTANDMSSVFNRKTFSDVDAAKTAIISSDLANAIETNCSSINYTLDANNLILNCYHENDTKESNMAVAMNASGWSSEAGAVYSTLS